MPAAGTAGTPRYTAHRLQERALRNPTARPVTAQWPLPQNGTHRRSANTIAQRDPPIRAPNRKNPL